MKGKTLRVHFLTIGEAREVLARAWAESLAADIDNAVSLFLECKVPSLLSLSDRSIATAFGELNLGLQFALQGRIDQVIVRLDTTTSMGVWDIENVHPNERDQFRNEKLELSSP